MKMDMGGLFFGVTVHSDRAVMSARQRRRYQEVRRYWKRIQRLGEVRIPLVVLRYEDLWLADWNRRNINRGHLPPRIEVVGPL